MKSPESPPGNSSGQKHDEPPPLPRNTYMYRRPESHQDAPCFTVGRKLTEFPFLRVRLGLFGECGLEVSFLRFTAILDLFQVCV